jgi:mycothiol synthase
MPDPTALAALAPLPVGLPPDWRARRPTLGDQRIVYDLVAACDIDVLGYADISLADVQSDLVVDPELQLLVVDGADGADDGAVAWARLHDRAGGRTVADAYVHPRLENATGDRLAAWCWDLLVTWTAGVATRRGLASTELDVGVLDGDALGEQRLARAGLSPRRTFWRMQRPLTQADAAPQLSPDVLVRPVTFDDRTTVHRIVESAFVDHWNHHPRGFREWWGQVRAHAGFDLGLWWLAEVDGHPAGVLIATRQMADEDAIYVATLATLREYRRRGVATSLLRKAFAAGLAEGWSVAKLNVDSQSTTAATSVYAGVGLEVAFSVRAWGREVPAG